MLRYYIVDAFTDHPFGGNPAGVVLLDGQEFPNEGLMQRIAAELRYSETVFVKQASASAAPPPSSPREDFSSEV